MQRAVEWLCAHDVVFLGGRGQDSPEVYAYASLPLLERVRTVGNNRSKKIFSEPASSAVSLSIILWIVPLSSGGRERSFVSQSLIYNIRARDKGSDPYCSQQFKERRCSG